MMHMLESAGSLVLVVTGSATVVFSAVVEDVGLGIGGATVLVAGVAISRMVFRQSESRAAEYRSLLNASHEATERARNEADHFRELYKESEMRRLSEEA